MKKKIAVVVSIIFSVLMPIACDSIGPSTREVEIKGTLMMATTTSTADTGLLEYLAPQFLMDTGWELQYVAVGAGEALEMGRNGDVDILLVNDRGSEIVFVAEDFGVERFPIMYNEFIVIGPGELVEYGHDVQVTFVEIFESQFTFVSRGDDSGTDRREKAIWEMLEIDPRENHNYLETGQGMEATIAIADEEQAFCLTDRSTWLRKIHDSDVTLELEVICEGDSILFNQYGVIAINPERYPTVNYQAAEAFIKWITSEEIQALIGQFGIEAFGEPLFIPNAGSDS